MSMTQVTFSYHLGLTKSQIERCRNAKLTGAALAGSWNADGAPTEDWSRHSMDWIQDDAGCVAFQTKVSLDGSFKDHWFRWGVTLYFADKFGLEKEVWGVPTEVRDASSSCQHRLFQLDHFGSHAKYQLVSHRYLGANRWRRNDGELDGIRFSVWAPNAQQVDVVFGRVYNADDASLAPANMAIPFNKIAGGYISDDGIGIRPDWPVIGMTKSEDGIWSTDPNDPALPREGKFLNHVPYMYRIKRSGGDVRMRTDIYSRCQIGYGSINPATTSDLGSLETAGASSVEPLANWNGLISTLDGTKSCSVTVDPHFVTTYFKEEPPYHPSFSRVWPEREFQREAEFWANEFPDGNQLVRNVRDLISYELHPGALGFGRNGPGTIEDAIHFLDHIVDSGFNAVELLPMSEFAGGAENWGYATSHYFALEYGGGGRDQFKHFVRAAHQRGIAVIMDVVYNHFAHDAERAEFQFDSDKPEENHYYWYEGISDNYSDPEGGYLNNVSTAWAPRYHEEQVRKMFISSAIALVTEFHIDGFRVDQTTSIREYNTLNADGRSIHQANQFGAKLLREFGRTLRLVKPNVILIAEDHSHNDDILIPVDNGGMGFDAKWYSDFYHHLLGDTNRGEDCASLIYASATTMNNGLLKIGYFSGALHASQFQKVVYAASHDEAGNSRGPFFDPDYDRRDPEKSHTSHRTLVVAVNAAPLNRETRKYAEARSRLAYGLVGLSAGLPMTFMGEEVGAVNRFKYNAVLSNREDYLGLATGDGKLLLQFYRDVNRLRSENSAIRSRNIEVILADDENRVLVFRRWDQHQNFLIFCSLNDRPFDSGFCVNSNSIPSRVWLDCLNSDSHFYGGWNIGNGSSIASRDGQLTSRIPQCGVLVLKAQ